MPVVPNVAGPAQVKIHDGTQFFEVGLTRNGADITHEAYWLDVPGDQNGGDNGPPIDIQFLGEIGRVRLEFTKWDKVVANQIRARARSATAGQPTVAGTLMFGDLKYLRLLINAVNDPINFPVAIPRAPIEINRGVKYSVLVCEFECHKGSDGVLYNALTT